MDPLRYIVLQPMPIGKLAKWHMLLSEFDIRNVAQKAVKRQALADLLVGSPVDDNPVHLWTYFQNEKVIKIEGEENEDKLGWKVYFNGAVNSKRSGIGAVLVLESGQYYPVATMLNFRCTNNMAEYEAFIIGLRLSLDMDVRKLQVIGDSNLLIHQVRGERATKNETIIPCIGLVQILADRFQEVKFKHIPRAQNEFTDVLATITSMIQYPDSKYIDPVRVEIRDQPAHYAFIEAYIDGKPWTPVLGFLRCVDSVEATRLIEEVHVGTCGPHINGFILAKKILRTGYYWMTMENDCSKSIQKCHKCQIHGDLIKVPATELITMTSPWPFAAWGIDVIGPIELAASDKHCFIFVAIDYFTKWMEVESYVSVTKKVMADFVRNNIVCRFGIL
ncbi:uncharacterized protein LOC132630760 [Lycium barbarum]|uniref:uncharacterized protein LOC132630760 n=1 Tax=Lycium barbarum TaxID=112863 RepID=UPI00293F18CF|nr:uncharacterized protein LOC132630760 [Lycium barbarum]